MLNTRNVVAAAVVLTAVSLLGGLLAFLRPPGGGLGIDSYGTRGHGYRGLYEILAELKIPVERAEVPPSRVLKRDATLALIEPSPEIVSTEPVYLHAISKWVREGGTVVVAPSIRDPMVRDSSIKEVLSELGLEGVHVATVGPAADWRPVFRQGQSRTTVRTETRRAATNFKRLFLGDQTFKASLVHATADGAYAKDFPNGLDLMIPDVERCQLVADDADLPAKDKATETSREKGPGAKASAVKQSSEKKTPPQNTAVSRPSGRILATLEPDGDPEPIAAVFPLGMGRVVVLADARLAQNRLVGQADNPVLVAHLLADSGKPVMFDEFYHGLTIRSNPFWLLSRFPYGILAASVLAATLVMGWRAYRYLGPPLAPRPVSRRTLSEYVEAMARLLNRSKQPAHFLLTEIRQGLLWRLRHDLGLPPGNEEVDKIVWILERRDPPLAQKAREAIRAIDDSLARPNQSAKELAATLAKVSVCVPRQSV
jgi:Domain of unknown function (DUF4350)